jgi:hypothetical protein
MPGDAKRCRGAQRQSLNDPTPVFLGLYYAQVLLDLSGLCPVAGLLHNAYCCCTAV